MTRQGFHAACGALETVDGRLRCTKCGTVITDALQIAPRPHVEIPQPDSGVLLRTYLERRSRYLTPVSFETLR